MMTSFKRLSLSFAYLALGLGNSIEVVSGQEYNFGPEINRLSTMAKPLPPSGVDPAFCQDFIYAHRKYCKEPDYDPVLSEKLAQFFVEETDYVSDETLFKELEEGFAEEKKEIGDEPFIVLVDRRKSSEWFSYHMRDKLPKGKVHFIEVTDPSYGTKKEDVDPGGSGGIGNLVRFLDEHPEIKHVIRFDDASYSGNQVKQYMMDVKLAARKIRPIANRKLNLHMIVPSSSSVADNLVSNAEKETAEIEFRWKPKHRIKNLGEKFQDFSRDHGLDPELLKKYNYSRRVDSARAVDFEVEPYDKFKNHASTLPLLFFQHKLPDYMSTLKSYMHSGSIMCFKKNEAAPMNPLPEIGFPCVPEIETPYKSRSNNDHKHRFDPQNPIYGEVRKEREAFEQGMQASDPCPVSLMSIKAIEELSEDVHAIGKK